MEFTQLNPAALTELIKLVEEKQTIVDQITKLDARIIAVATGKAPTETDSKALKAPRPTATAPAETPPAPAAAKAPVAPRARRGALKEGILAALEAAGAQGMAVSELSAQLGVEPGNIHVWFSTTGKKLSEITKISAGRYALAAAGVATVAAVTAVTGEVAARPEPIEEPAAEAAPLDEEPPASAIDEIEEPTPVAAAADVVSEVAVEEPAPSPEEPAAGEIFEETTTVEPIAEDTPPNDDEFQLVSSAD